MNYEGFRKTVAQTSIGTVPTELEAAGDFSQSGVAIYDPASSRPNPGVQSRSARPAPRIRRCFGTRFPAT